MRKSYHANLSALQSLTRRSLSRALTMLEMRGGSVRDSIFVAMDVGRTPGTELAISVFADNDQLPRAASRRLVEARLDRARRNGLPFILAAVVPSSSLLELSGISAPSRRTLGHWLSNDVPALHFRTVAIAGASLSMEHLPIEVGRELYQA